MTPSSKEVRRRTFSRRGVAKVGRISRTDAQQVNNTLAASGCWTRQTGAAR